MGENKEFTDKVFEHIANRSANARISDSFSRSTYFISNDSIEALDNICRYVELLGSVDGEFASSRGEDSQRYRILSKSFKSVAVNMVLDSLIEQFTDEHDGVPIVEKVRYFNKQDKLYYRAFLVTDEDNIYYQELDNRGNTIKFYSNTVSDHLFATEDEMNALFRKRQKEAGVIVDETIEEKPTKRSILDELDK